jgi:hypothetical protein
MNGGQETNIWNQSASIFWELLKREKCKISVMTLVKVNHNGHNFNGGQDGLTSPFPLAI